MSDHPIQGLMKTAMEQITEMVNVNTIVGDPIETGNGDVIMPISRVNFGFAAGGSDFGKEHTEAGEEAKQAKVALPFGGGSGGGVSITPIAFLVVSKSGVKIVPLDNQTHLIERLIDSAPQVVDRIQSMIQGTMASVANSTSGANNTANQAGNYGSSGASGNGYGGGMSQGPSYSGSSGGSSNISGGSFSGTGYVSTTSGETTVDDSFTNGVTEAYASGGAGFPEETTKSTKG